MVPGATIRKAQRLGRLSSVNWFPCDRAVVFESYWDAFAYMDKSGERSGIIITRGAENGKLVAGLIPTGATVYAWKQNDELKNGKRAGDEWLKGVAEHAGAKVLSPKHTLPIRDLNDWTRAGATSDDFAGRDAQRGSRVRAAEVLGGRAERVSRYIE